MPDIDNILSNFQGAVYYSTLAGTAATSTLSGYSNCLQVQTAASAMTQTVYFSQQMAMQAIGGMSVLVSGSWVSVNDYQSQPSFTEEEIAAQKKAEEERAKARARARQLLVRLLSAKQREQFEKDSSFELEVNDRLYRVKTGARVERLDRKTKKVESYFCIHPAEHLPWEDVAISQKLLLEADEKEFLRLANETKAA